MILGFHQEQTYTCKENPGYHITAMAGVHTQTTHGTMPITTKLYSSSGSDDDGQDSLPVSSPDPSSAAFLFLDAAFFAHVSSWLSSCCP